MNDPPHQDQDRRRRASPRVLAMLGSRPPGSHLRLIDILFAPIAAVIGLALFVLAFVPAYGLSLLLSTIGVPAGFVGFVTLVVGIGGGGVLSFIVLVRLYRRLPKPIREALAGEELDD